MPSSENLNYVPFVPVNTILHIGYPMSELQDEFKRNCKKYIFLHRDSPTLKNDLIHVFSLTVPNIVFSQLQAEGILDIKLVQAMKKTGAYVINWTGDARRPIPNWYKEYAPFFDITLFSNETDVEEMQSLGYRSAFLNIGFETKLYNPLDIVHMNYDIVFMGNNYPGVFPLSTLRIQMVDALKTEFGSSFHVFGNGWENSMTTTDKQEAAIYRGSKMAISLSHYDLERYFSDRMLRIMGCSTLCLAKWYPGIEKDFTDGVHLVVWRDIQELITKIHYYMDHPKERFIIARGGHLRVGLEHTWSIRIGQLQKIIYDNPKIPHVEKKVKVFKFLRL
jgi:spore maturation protein CgeB